MMTRYRRHIIFINNVAVFCFNRILHSLPCKLFKVPERLWEGGHTTARQDLNSFRTGRLTMKSEAQLLCFLFVFLCRLLLLCLIWFFLAWPGLAWPGMAWFSPFCWSLHTSCGRAISSPVPHQPPSPALASVPSSVALPPRSNKHNFPLSAKCYPLV